jgi:hypothetical protein
MLQPLLIVFDPVLAAHASGTCNRSICIRMCSVRITQGIKTATNLHPVLSSL